MADALFAPAHLFPDGYYRLKEDVSSPLPARLTRSRRSRGWARPRWNKGTEFKVESSLMVTVEFIGATPKLSARQRDAVARALTASLEPIPMLPRYILREDYTDGVDALDALFMLGKITLDDVREAVTALNAVGALGQYARDLGKPQPPPPAHGALSALRVGDVVYDRTSADPDYYTITGTLPGDMYRWQRSAANATEFTAPWERHREPVFGHVGDLIAEGLAALAPSEPVGVDRYGKAVHCGDVLVSQNGEMRVRVVGRAEPIYGESAALYVHLAGPPIDVNSIALGSQNKWAIERPTAPPLAPVRHGNFGKPAPASETHDPFSLD